MYSKIIFIFDFDSTFTQVEALDILADIVFTGPTKNKKLEQIAHLTEKGMAGSISFSESLNERMRILSGTKKDINNLVRQLKSKISPSILRHKDFFKAYSNNIFIVSSGFKDFIDPVMADFNIPSNQVYANSFIWSSKNEITGFDSENVLSKDGGKPALIKKLSFPSPVVVIGDGYTDYEIRKEGFADCFIAYTENVSRPSVVKNADFVANNFNDFLNFISNEKTLLS
jgi:D-3-phosphoglycerate dehydrogenase / 2-oxoglutarate reductase